MEANRIPWESIGTDRQCLIQQKGTVSYKPALFDQEESENFFSDLLSSICWMHDTIRMYGREIITRRKVAWYGDRPFDYRYSGFSRLALPWTAKLLEVKARIENYCGAGFNSCLLNLYHNGSEGMGWHSDDESSLDPGAAIASLSFGQERRFQFRLKSNHSEKREIHLESGSLLMMDAESQRYWQHCLPVSAKHTKPRINLTFRSMK